MTFTWSPSAVISARTCLMQWHLQYGGGRQPGGEQAFPEHLSFGVVVHAGLEEAYRCAANAEAHRCGTMARFLDPALLALAERWRELRLPGSASVQAHVVAEIGAVLESLPTPHPRAVLGVEKTIRFTGRSGTPFKATLDLALRTGLETVHIRDWKRRSISSLPKGEELLDDIQLCQQRVAAQEQWPWVRRVTVGLFSTISCIETRPIELPLERALHRLDGHEVTAYDTENASEYPPSKGQACASCRVRPQCPVFAT